MVEDIEKIEQSRVAISSAPGSVRNTRRTLRPEETHEIDFHVGLRIVGVVHRLNPAGREDSTGMRTKSGDLR